MRYSNCLNRGNASYCWCPCNCLIWLEIGTAKGLWSLVLTRVTQTCLGRELWHLSYSKGMWVPRQFFFRTYGENSQEGKDHFRIRFVSHHRKGRFNLMLRIDHQSYNSTSNCYTFLNKRFVSIELYKMLGVELLTLVPFGSHVYIFSLQPWPQSRQVITGMMGSWYGLLLCMASQCSLWFLCLVGELVVMISFLNVVVNFKPFW